MLLLLLAGAVAATIPWHMHHEGMQIALGPLLSGVCFVATLFISLSLAEDRQEFLAAQAENAGLKLDSLAWKYSAGGYPFIATYDESVARRLYVDEMLGITNTLSSMVSDFRIGTSGAPVTEEMADLRTSSLTSRMETYRLRRLLPIASEAQARSVSARRRSKAMRSLARAFSAAALVVALCQAINLLAIDLVGAVTVASTVFLTWNSTRKYDVEAGDAVTQYERAALLIVRSDGISDESQWSAFVANSEDLLWSITRTAQGSERG
jgi:hypothetical protein